MFLDVYHGTCTYIFIFKRCDVSLRWKKGRGDQVNEHVSFLWDVKEPDLEEFDSEVRKAFPSNADLITKCTENPDFDCYESQDACKLTCPNSFIGTQQKEDEVGCAETTDGSCSGHNPLFLDYKFVLSSTEDALPACMAMYGPQFLSNLINNNDGGTSFTYCSSMFQIETSSGDIDSHYLKWFDLKCNQKTRSQICSLVGK